LNIDAAALKLVHEGLLMFSRSF